MNRYTTSWVCTLPPLTPVDGWTTDINKIWVSQVPYQYFSLTTKIVNLFSVPTKKEIFREKIVRSSFEKNIRDVNDCYEKIFI